MSFDSWHLTKLICKVIIKSHFSTCRLPSHPLWSDSITQPDLLGQLHDSPSVRDCGTFTPQSTGLQAANCLWKKEKHLKGTALSSANKKHTQEARVFFDVLLSGVRATQSRRTQSVNCWRAIGGLERQRRVTQHWPETQTQAGGGDSTKTKQSHSL